jgi:histidinol-phosphate aminotransferase
MTSSIVNYVRPAVSPARAYALAPRHHHEKSIFLNLNESPYPLSPRAREVIASFAEGNRYPEFTQASLRTAIGEYVGFVPERIAVGAGLDDVFQILATLFVDPGKEVVISDPTFGVYSTFFPLHGGKVVDVPLSPAPDFALDVEGVIDAVNDNTAFVMVCNPNNPTGTLFALEDIERIVTSVPCPVAIDEAYAEFAPWDHLELARKYPNVIILRTLSKFAGMAGLRVGYGIFPEDIAPHVAAATPAFGNISNLSAAVGVASLHDLDYLKANRDEQISERERVTALMNELPGVTAYPSATNHVLFKLPGDDATPVLLALNDRHIFVRHYPAPNLNLNDHLRVSIGLPDENTAFLTALEEILAGKESA